MRRKIRDFFERFFWTMVITVGANITGAALFDIDELKMAAVTAVAAGFQVVVVFGRYRLSVLPNPGEGLPGLPVKVS